MDARCSVTDVSYEAQHIWRSHSDMLGYNALSTDSQRHIRGVRCLHLQNSLQLQWSDFEVKWSEKKWSYGEVLGDKSTMYIRVTFYWGYLIVLWLFYLVCILYCGCFNLFCNVLVCVCGCFDNCVGVLVICVLVFTVFLLFVLYFCIV